MKTPQLNQAEKALVERILQRQSSDRTPTLAVQQVRLAFELAHHCLALEQESRAHAWVRWCDATIQDATAEGRVDRDAREEFLVRRRTFESAAAVTCERAMVYLNLAGLDMMERALDRGRR